MDAQSYSYNKVKCLTVRILCVLNEFALVFSISVGHSLGISVHTKTGRDRSQKTHKHKQNSRHS